MIHQIQKQTLEVTIRDKDVLSKMNFKPRLGIVKEMDSRLFRNDKMDIKTEFFQKIKK